MRWYGEKWKIITPPFNLDRLGIYRCSTSDKYAEMELPSGERLHGSCMKFSIEFQALFIKTCLLVKRKRVQTIIEILLAYTFMGLLLGMRHILEREYNPAFKISRFRPQDFMIFSQSSANIIYYYPCELFIPFIILKIRDNIFLRSYIANPCTDTIVTNAINMHALSRFYLSNNGT